MLAMDDAKNAQSREPTEDELFFARKIFKQQKDKADADDAKQQQQQATNSAIAANTVATNVIPSAVVKRQ